MNSRNNDISPTKAAWLWLHDCLEILPFAAMQRVAQVHQRQYLLNSATLSASQRSRFKRSSLALKQRLYL